MDIKLSYCDTQAYRGYRKTIGKNHTGKPKTFYLGQDKPLAEQKALALLGKWKAIQANGDAFWDEKSIKVALQAFHAPELRGTQREPSYENSIIDEIDNEIVRIKASGGTGKNWATLNGRVARLQYVKKAIEHLNINNPLREIGAKEIETLVEHFKSRPFSEHRRERISVIFAADCIRCLRRVLDDWDRREIWRAPRRFNDFFSINKKAMMTPAERRESGDIETITLPELKAMMNACIPRQQMFIVLSLNTGATQSELATMMRSDFKGSILERRRNKTGVKSRHVLWAETMTLLEGQFAPATDSGLAFRTSHGTPLVEFFDGAKTDSIQKWWLRLRENTGIEKQFKLLRKTGASFLRPYGVEQLYLAHAPSTMADKHYCARPLEMLDEPLAKMREWLKEGGVFSGIAQ